MTNGKQKGMGWVAALKAISCYLLDSFLNYITSKIDTTFLDFCLCFKGARITVRNALVAENVSSVRRAFSVLCEVADCIVFGIVLEDTFLWKMMGNHV